MTHLEVIDMLRRVELDINNGWCQKFYAIDIEGQEVWRASDKSKIVAKCLSKAILDNSYLRTPMNRIHKAFQKYTAPMNIPSWNDWPGRTKEEVIELIQKVIVDISKGDW